MTARETNNNPVEVKGICINMRGPHLIALPIPNSDLGLITSVDFRLSITNNSSNALPLHIYQSIVPQLMASDGQEIPRISAQESESNPTSINIPQQPNLGEKFTRFLANLVTWLEFRNWPDRDRIFYLMSLEKYTSLTVTALLFWHHDRLQLKFIPVNNVSRFDAIQSQQYRLRFVGINFNTYRLNSELQTTEGADSEQPASQFVNLCLVEPLETNKNAVEVDGICFETVVSEPMIQVSGSKSDSPIYVEFGMNITNNTLIPVRFNLFNSLVPQLIISDGHQIQSTLFYRMEIAPKESHFPLVMPGESISFLPCEELVWNKNNQLYLSIYAIDGGIWSFSKLNVGKYYIQFAYRNQNTDFEIERPDLENIQLISDIWTGLVFAPYVELNLA